jgi:hypothetical protein
VQQNINTMHGPMNIKFKIIFVVLYSALEASTDVVNIT